MKINKTLRFGDFGVGAGAFWRGTQKPLYIGPRFARNQPLAHPWADVAQLVEQLIRNAGSDSGASGK